MKVSELGSELDRTHTGHLDTGLCALNSDAALDFDQVLNVLLD